MLTLITIRYIHHSTCMIIGFSNKFATKRTKIWLQTKFDSLKKVMSHENKPFILFVLGAPGSGKGTQCSKIVEKFQFAHLSAGDLLRAERNASGSPYGTLIETHIKNGTIVPVEITCSLIERAIHASSAQHFLIDGFPRNENNLEGWNRVMSDKVVVLGVLFLECSEEACMRRCLARGAAGSGRSDDNEESLRKRFVTYQKDTVPIINYYREKNLVFPVNTNASADEVFQEVVKIIRSVAPDTDK